MPHAKHTQKLPGLLPVSAGKVESCVSKSVRLSLVKRSSTRTLIYNEYLEVGNQNLKSNTDTTSSDEHLPITKKQALYH